MLRALIRIVTSGVWEEGLEGIEVFRAQNAMMVSLMKTHLHTHQAADLHSKQLLFSTPIMPQCSVVFKELIKQFVYIKKKWIACFGFFFLYNNSKIYKS